MVAASRRAGSAAPVPQPTAPEAPGTPSSARVVAEPWPQGISRHPTMRISDVLAALSPEFPAISHSKLRFLEERGLVTPVRTPAGYRQYSLADVERLRYVLRQQRDRYLPLKVIGEQLAELDAGRSIESLAPQLVAEDGEPATPAGAGRQTVDSLASSLGLAPELVQGLVDGGVLTADETGQLEPWAGEVARLAATLAEHGLDARHLRPFRQAAERQADLVEQVVAPWRSQRSGSARAHAATVAAEVGELCAQLHTALVRGAVANLDA